MESLRCLLDTPGLRISYDAANHWLYNQWIGVYDEATVRERVQDVFACLATQPCRRILSDHSQLTGSWLSASVWIGEYYFDRLVECGITHFAWVYSAAYPDRLAMEKALSFTMHPVVAIFDEVASAYEWLHQCPLARPATAQRSRRPEAP